MPRRASLYPTEAELEVLSILWRQGPSTVREVHEILQTDRRTGLTTTLKILQVMEDKGLVARNESRPHRYSAASPEEKTQAGMLNDLVRRAFDGSVRKLLIRAVEDGNLSSEVLQEIRRLIDSRGKGGKEGK